MSSEKECVDCGVSKPLSEFYVHKQMRDGHLNKCKSCVKSRVGKHRLENIDRIREYDRDRAKRPERSKLATAQTRKWRNEDRRRVAAHNAVARAIRSGKLVPKPCERCGSVNSLAHHENYDRKLDVTWLCQPHHKERHKELVLAGIDP